jgi:hypothetical protein
VFEFGNGPLAHYDGTTKQRHAHRFLLNKSTVEMKWKANLNGDDEAMKKKMLEKTSLRSQTVACGGSKKLVQQGNAK